MPYLNRLTNMHCYPELDKGHVAGSKARTICVRVKCKKFYSLYQSQYSPPDKTHAIMALFDV